MEECSNVYTVELLQVKYVWNWFIKQEMAILFFIIVFMLVPSNQFPSLLKRS